MRVAGGYLLALALCGASCACGGTGAGGVRTPWAAETLPDPPEPPANPTTPEKRALGRLLFYDPVLSADRDTACATCHSELWGMSDGLPRSVGTGGSILTGPGRVGHHQLRRNAQTLWNVAYRDGLMWDGRVRGAEALESQVELPLSALDELGRDPHELAGELAEVPEYAELFADAFPERDGEISPRTLALALAVFERSLVSDRAPYDRYIEGDDNALDPQSERGMWLFSEGGCSECHVPPRFESERFADRGLSRDPVDLKVAGIKAVDTEAPAEDDGRFEVSGLDADRGAFRVPTLRNVRESGPYFHDGREPDLRAAIAHELAAGPVQILADDSDVDDLMAFVSKALMDRTREPDRPEAVPSGLPVPVDGFRIPR